MVCATDITWLEHDLGRDVQTSNDSFPSMFTARYWLQECERRHPKCHLEKGSAVNLPLPTRLLEIQQVNKVRLVFGKNILANRKYVTLSHCWGKGHRVGLRQNTIRSFEGGIPTNTLSKTFQDAVKITNQLGVRYLWVDSLCIIQDDLQDLAHEITIIDRIYQGSYCNIAATQASDSEGSCFAQRDLMDVRPCKIRSTWNSEPAKTLYCWAPSFWDQSIEESKLISRGWVLQERVLATRVIHFAHDQMFWECLEHRACETFPGGLPNQTTKLSLNPHSLRSEIIQITDPTALRYSVWCKALNAYSHCDLTFPEKDKLTAISGLARRIGAAEDYVAGLWWNILPRELMWMVSEGSLKSRPSEYRAPSWSWASIDGPIISREPIAYASQSTLIEIIDIDIRHESFDRFGQVQHGSIKLNGPIGKFIINYTRFMTATRKWMGESLANVVGDCGPFPARSEICCLVIERDKNDGGLYGIVIRPSRGVKGMYVRCGWFAFFNRSDTTDDSYLGVAGAEPLRQKLDASEYEEYTGSDEITGFHSYVITLI